MATILDSRTAEKIRQLISTARSERTSDSDIVRGHFSGYEDVADLVDAYKHKGYIISEDGYVEFAKRLLEQNTTTVLAIQTPEVEEAFVHLPDGGSWTAYKKTLEESGFDTDSIHDTELYSRWIVSRLTRTGDKPCKGLVMGSVQSGKTVNMGAVMSMAADAGFNFIVVFSGTLNSLRDQTMGRFESDLRSCASAQWEILDLNRRDVNLRHCDFRPCSAKRYLAVCIKHHSRLRGLCSKLEQLRAAKEMVKMLVIDDEADQAGINTSDISQIDEVSDRTATNRNIVKLVTNRLGPNDAVSDVRFGAVNYLCYTATPYANLLNEPPGEDSLYPSSFVLSLPEPKIYFGTKVIFGNPEDGTPGLNIVREIGEEESHFAGSDQVFSYGDVDLPEFKRAFAWFVCAASSLRARGYKKPISMLVHPSARIFAHENMDKVLFSWLKRLDDEAFLELCRRVYEDEKNAFTKDDLQKNFPDGYRLIDNVPDEPLKFDDIKDGILLLKNKIGRIEGSDKSNVKYHDGIHVCVDNSAAQTDGCSYFRIAYPKKDDLARLQFAPVFVVIGGATLSRGLTIEGLVCSYFARDIRQADTLMQMGRWFGYRKGYELYQRIWMTRATRDRFRQMTRMDVALKRELDNFRVQNKNPSDYGPEVLCFPDSVRLRLTAENRMQSATMADLSYDGYSFETTEFKDDAAWQADNAKRVGDFIRGLGRPDFPSPTGTGGVVWANVESSKILRFFRDHFGIWDGSLLSEEMPSFREWLRKENENGSYTKWAVAVCGPAKKPATPLWRACDGVDVGCIGRTRRNDGSQDCIDIGSLRSGLDALIDIRRPDLTSEQAKVFDNAMREKKDLIRVRSKLGKKEIPLLLVYAINAGEGALMPRAGDHRSAIRLGRDSVIAAVSVIIPGDPFGKKHIQSVTVRIPKYE